MVDLSFARRMMVDGQIRTSDVTDRNLLAALLDVPRERFVPPQAEGIAYLDIDIAVSGSAGRRDARRLLKPMILGKLLQAAEIGADDTVLDVGCATGYSAAILARLAGKVVALEEDPALAAQAERNLRDLGAANVTVVQGPLRDGWPALATYDVILLDGWAEVLPPALPEQLREEGKLLGVVGAGPATKAMLYRRSHGQLSGRPIFDAVAAALPGFARPPEFVF